MKEDGRLTQELRPNPESCIEILAIPYLIRASITQILQPEARQNPETEKFGKSDLPDLRKAESQGARCARGDACGGRRPDTLRSGVASETEERQHNAFPSFRALDSGPGQKKVDLSGPPTRHRASAIGPR